MSNNKRKRGFTLIEIIICITLLAMIGLISVVSLKKEDSSLPDHSKDREELEIVVDLINKRFENSNQFNKYDSTEYSTSDSSLSTTFFCISKQTIIEMGVMDETSETLVSIPDDQYIKVEKDSLGNLDLVYPVNVDDCKYYVANVSSVSGGSGSITGGTTDDSYELSQTFSEVSENKYKMEINFSKDIYREEITPLYVLFVLDISGSMISNDRNGDAKTAIKNFGENILSTISYANIGFLPFGSWACPQSFNDISWTNSCLNNGVDCWTDDISAFKNKVTAINYSTSCGNSNTYSDAYDKILNTYDVGTLNSDSMVYVVLFSDAGDDQDCDASFNYDYAVNKIPPKVDKFIFVAYTPGNRNCLSTFSTDINKKYPGRSLHYLSSSTEVANTLSSISNKIHEETEYKNVQISIEIDKEYFKIEADSSWNVNHTTNVLTKTIDFSTFMGESLETNLNFDIVYNAKTNVNSYSEEVAIIKSFELKFEKKDGTFETVSLSASDLPKSSITTSEHSVVN